MDNVDTTEQTAATEVGEGQASPAPSLAEALAPEDQAAHDFSILLPLFIQKIESFSSLRQLKRVAIAMAAYPLEPRYTTLFAYPIEGEAFNLGQNLSDCKFTLMHAILKLTPEQRAELLASTEKKEEAVKEKEKEEENVGN